MLDFALSAHPHPHGKRRRSATRQSPGKLRVSPNILTGLNIAVPSSTCRRWRPETGEQPVTLKPGLQVFPDGVPIAKSLRFWHGFLRDLHRRRHCRLLLSPFGSATARLQLVCSGTENDSSRCGRRGLSGSSLIQSALIQLAFDPTRLRARIFFAPYHLRLVSRGPVNPRGAIAVWRSANGSLGGRASLARTQKISSVIPHPQICERGPRLPV